MHPISFIPSAVESTSDEKILVKYIYSKSPITLHKKVVQEKLHSV